LADTVAEENINKINDKIKEEIVDTPLVEYLIVSGEEQAATTQKEVQEV
jgi:hypothetical protein